jgi:hypothetical protein
MKASLFLRHPPSGGDQPPPPNHNEIKISWLETVAAAVAIQHRPGVMPAQVCSSRLKQGNPVKDNAPLVSDNAVQQIFVSMADQTL